MCFFGVVVCVLGVLYCIFLLPWRTLSSMETVDIVRCNYAGAAHAFLPAWRALCRPARAAGIAPAARLAQVGDGAKAEALIGAVRAIFDGFGELHLRSCSA